MSYLLSMIFQGWPGRNRASLSVALTMLVINVSGCSSARPLQVDVSPVEVAKPTALPAVPRPEPIHLLPIEWSVVTPDRLPKEGDWVLIGLSPKGYENLGKNQAEILRWVEEAILRFRYYEGETGGDK